MITSRYTLTSDAHARQFLAVSLADERTIAAAFDAAGIAYTKCSEVLTSEGKPACAVFHFSDLSNVEAIENALSAVMRTASVPKALRPTWS